MLRPGSALIASLVLAAACGRTDPPRATPTPATASTTAATASPDAEMMPGLDGPLPPEIAADVQQLADRERATARAGRGTVSVRRAWRYAGGPALAAGHAWIALDVDFGALAIDTDDLELADADPAHAVAAIGDVQRLDANGHRIPLADGAHAGEAHYLLMFDLPATTKHVALRYWGETLTGAPVEVAPDGPVFAEPSRQILRHFADSNRHVFLVEDRNQDDTPSLGGRWFADVDRKACAPRAFVPVDAGLAPVPPPADPPTVIARALYLVELRCTQTPHVLAWGPHGTPLPAAEPLLLPAAAEDALAGRAPDTTVLELPEEGRAKIAVRADGAMVAVSPGRGLELRLLDPLHGGAEIARLPGPTDGTLLDLFFTPDGAHLIGVEEGGDVTAWDVATRTRAASRRFEPPPDLYSSLVMSPDGRLAAIDHPRAPRDQTEGRVAWSGVVEIVSVPDLTPRATLQVLPDTEHALDAVGFSADGKRVIACANDHVTRIYAVAGGKLLAQIPGDAEPTTCAFLPDGRVAIGYDDGRLAIHDAAGRRRAIVDAHPGGVRGLAVRADGAIFTGGSDGIARRWTRDATAPVPLVHLRHGVGVRLAGDLVVVDATDEVAILDAAGHERARLRGGPDWIETPAAAAGTVAIIDSMLALGRARVRIWRAPAPAAKVVAP